MYLSFFEEINNYKNITTEKLVETLNKFQPSTDELIEKFKFREKSLNTKINNFSDITIEDTITEKDLAAYKSTPSISENESFQKNLNSITDSTKLSKKELFVLNEKRKNKTYVQIAKENNCSIIYIRSKTISAIAKIQEKQNVLPEDFNKMAQAIADTYKINDKNKIRRIIVNNPNLLSYGTPKILNNIDTTSKLLQIEPKDLIKSALKNSRLLYLKPETILNNVNKSAKLLQIEVKNLIKAAIKQPQSLYMKPETIAKKTNIIKYYKKIQCKNDERIVISIFGANRLYERILNYLIKEKDNLETFINNKELKNYIIKSNKIYNFEIPADELAEEFIRFAKDFSIKTLGKNIFKFKII